MKVLRMLLLCILIQLLGAAILVLAVEAKIFVYISCADDSEIVVLEMNPDNGDMTLTGRAKVGKTVMPMAISPDHRFLYASIRSIPFSVASYSINPGNGQLIHLSTVPLPDNMAYISTDKTGRFLFSASYAGHKISVNPIGEKGFVQADPVQVMIAGRNAHAILVDLSNRFVYVPNLGSDQIMQLIFNEKTGFLTPNKPGAVYTRNEEGPRHLTFSPNNRFVYVINELTGTVNAYNLDPQTGLLTEIQTISAVPRNANVVPGKPGPPIGGNNPPRKVDRPEIWAADIQITPDGKFLYASERTTNSLSAFLVDGLTGKLTYINSYETEAQPRGIRIDPRGSFVVAAGQKSAHASVYRINKVTGELQRLKRYQVGNDPNWIEIVEFP